MVKPKTASLLFIFFETIYNPVTPRENEKPKKKTLEKKEK